MGENDMLFWRGWGFWVYGITFGWMFILIGIMIATGSHEQDAAKAAAFTDRLFGLSFILSALSVFLLSRYRNNTPHQKIDPSTGRVDLIPNHDEFMFIPMRYWTYLLAVISGCAFIKSFFE
jgi:hypothetical protein